MNQPTSSRWRILMHCPGADPHEAGRDEIAGLLRQADCHLWIDVLGPSDDDVAFLGDTFGFHPLAVEDALNRQQRPKIDQYPGHTFLVLYAGGAQRDGRLELAEIDLFSGPRYLVVVHADPAKALDTAAERWRNALSDPGSGLVQSAASPTDVALYAVLDSVVDDYFPMLDVVAEQIEQIEGHVFGPVGSRDIVRDLIRLRRRLLQLRRQLGPTRDVVNVLARRELDLGESGIGAYYLDVYDHVVRAVETVDLHHDVIVGALDAHVSVSSFRLNETMRTMTALATILMSMALVTGVYGMNFTLMPELGWSLGYPWALGLMALVGGGVALVFRRRGWL